MRSPSESRSTELSNREQQVLTLIAKGLTNDEIAAMLHISLSTVKTHIRGIFNKLGVNHRIQAVMIAFEKGLV